MLPSKIKETFDETVPKQLGNETRTSILPKASQDAVNWRPPEYDYADELPTPAEVGVRRDDTLSSVVDAVGGMGYYTDMVAFGEESGLSPIRPSRKPTPLGLRYFMPTYQKCPNGEKMWVYVDGVPQGTAMGQNVKKAMDQLGLPGLRGLAPGMIEDTKAALDPVPLAQAIVGNPYPDCEEKTLPVGDATGAYQKWFPNATPDGKGGATETHWIQKKDKKGNPVFIPFETWSNAQKVKESFIDTSSSKTTAILVVALGLFTIGLLMKH